MQTAQVKQRRARQSVDEQVEIAALAVTAVQRGTENARIGCPVATRSFAYGTALAIQGIGRLHGNLLASR